MYVIGDEYPVWWDTDDGRPAGQHKARILGLRPYTGIFKEHFTHFLKLHAPSTRKGWLEMAV